MTLASYATIFLRQLAHAAAPGTVRGYGCVLRKHILPALGDRELEALSPDDVRPVFDELTEDYEPATVRMILCAIRAMITRARIDGYMTTDPTQDSRSLPWLPKRRKRPPRAFAPDELETLLGAARARCPQFERLWLLLSRTGLRIGEALALATRHVHLEERWVYVDGTYHGAGDVGDPKTRAGFRYVDLSPDAVTMLQALLGERRITRGDWLFPGEGEAPYHARTVQAAFAEVRQEAGLGYCTPHTLRHTFASWLIASGASIQRVKDQMGHSSIQTTVDLYGSWFRLRDPDAADQLDRVARGEYGARLHRPPLARDREPEAKRRKTTRRAGFGPATPMARAPRQQR